MAHFYHYTSERAWEEAISLPDRPGGEIPNGLRPMNTLADIYGRNDSPDLPAELKENVIEGLLDPIPLSWTDHKMGMSGKSVWENAVLAIAIGRPKNGFAAQYKEKQSKICLLKVDVTPEDPVYVLDFKPIIDQSKDMHVDARLTAYLGTKRPFYEYLQNPTAEIPIVISWERVPPDKCSVALRLTAKELYNTQIYKEATCTEVTTRQLQNFHAEKYR